MVKKPELFRVFIVYLLTKAVYKSLQAYKSIIYLKPNEIGGMNFSNEELILWHIYSIVPSFLIIMATPKIIPSMIS